VLARRVGRVLICFTVVVSLLAVTLVYAGPYLATWAIRFVFHELPFIGTSFTPAAWARAGDCTGLGDYGCERKWQHCERGPMVRTLLRNHLSVGKTRKAEV
jgi:hypothetical protein